MNQNRTSKHGGVLIAVKNQLSHELLDLKLEHPDYVAVQLKSSGKPTVNICCIYNSPSGSPYRWDLETLSSLLKKLANIEAGDLIVTGDINFDQTNWKQLSSHSQYEKPILNWFIDQNLSNSSPLQLDIFLSNKPENTIQCSVDHELQKQFSVNGKACSDHSPLRTCFEMLSNSTVFNPPDHKLAYKRADWDGINKAIVDRPFLPYCFSNVDEVLRQWYEWIWAIIEEFIPRVTEHRSSLPPWYSSTTSNLLKRLNTLKRNTNPTLSRIIKIKKLEKEISKCVEFDLLDFEKTVFEGRTFSKIQKYLKSIKKTSTIPQLVKLGDLEASDDFTKAELFNEYFASVFNQLDQVTIDLNRRELNTLNCNELKISKILNALDTNKSTGPDKIGNLLLKKCCDTLSKSLSLVFQTCTNKGIYPEYWKLSQVTPIFKDGNKANVSCYRPISLLSCCSKVCEKLIFDEIYEHVRDKLHANQFGFRKKRSATLQLLAFLDKVYEQNDEQHTQQLAVLYLDFAKAFDTVPHGKLLSKVASYGIGGKLLSIIASYLTDRKQIVKLNGTSSTVKNVTSGVPQGSLLGPLLFLLFINDLPEVIPQKAHSFGYADDFKVIVRNQQEMDETTERVGNWLISNEMRPNTKKSHVLNIKGQINAKLLGESLTETKSQRDLGLIVQSNLTWRDNCSLRSTKAMNALFQIKRNISKASHWTTRLNAYTGYVVPIVTYASQAWLPSRLGMQEIERVQQVATKWIVSASMPYKERLRWLNLLPLSLYSEMHDLLYLLSIQNGDYDYNMTSTDVQTTRTETTRQADRGGFRLPKTRLTRTDDNFFRRTKSLFNIVSNVYQKFGNTLNKSTLTTLYWHYFESNYNKENKCTWRILCRCGNCNPASKI